MTPEAWLASTLETAGNCPAYPVMGREGVQPPYIVYTRDMTMDELALDLGVGDPAPIAAIYMVDVFSDSYLQSREIAAAIRVAMKNFSGSGSGLTIHTVSIENDRDAVPVLLDGRDIPTYQAELFIKIVYEV